MITIKIFVPSVLSILLLAIAQPVDAGTNACTRSRIPAELKSQISKTGGAWRIVDKSDLSSDDQAYWTKTHAMECPGFTTGNFDGTGARQFAILLKSNQNNFRLLFARQDNEGMFKLSKLTEIKLANTPVIHSGKPGKYFDATDRTKVIETKLPVIVLEAIESSATAYYFTHGRFTPIVIAD